LGGLGISREKILSSLLIGTCKLAVTMNKHFCVIAVVLICLGVAGCRLRKPNKNSETLIEFKLSRRGVYCGGARPSEEMLAQLEELVPLENFQFFIKEGTTNNPDEAAIFSSITDDEGLAFVNLKPGTYLLIFEDKLDWTQYNHWKLEFAQAQESFGAMDTLCLREWIKQPEAVFTVVRDSSNMVEVVRWEKCFWNNIPCVEYRGSLPP
jgi:hypothetical protein